MKINFKKKIKTYYKEIDLKTWTKEDHIHQKKVSEMYVDIEITFPKSKLRQDEYHKFKSLVLMNSDVQKILQESGYDVISCVKENTLENDFKEETSATWTFLMEKKIHPIQTKKIKSKPLPKLKTAKKEVDISKDVTTIKMEPNKQKSAKIKKTTKKQSV